MYLKIRSLIEEARTFLTRPEVRKYVLPYRKPLTGFLTAAGVYVCVQLGAPVPEGLSLVAGAVVAYFVPENVRKTEFLVVLEDEYVGEGGPLPAPAEWSDNDPVVAERSDLDV